MSAQTTHWLDDRQFVITDRQRKDLGSDYRDAYNIPARMVRGVARPLYLCVRCSGTGDEPMATYDRCDVCRGAGGMPAAPDA